MHIQGIALFGAAAAVLVVWQANRALRHGGSFYDREVYGMTPCMHRRIRFAAIAAACFCLCFGSISAFPMAAFVALETVGVILYLASFARGASEEE